MKTQALLLVLLLALAGTGFAQRELPSKFIEIGAGLQPDMGDGTYQASGFTSICGRTADIPFLGGLSFPHYACQATDYFGEVTSARADSKGVLAHKGRWAGGWQVGIGGATGQTAGLSTSFGGWTAYQISSKFFVGVSGSWQRDHVMVALKAPRVQMPDELKRLAARGVYRLGFGYTF